MTSLDGVSQYAAKQNVGNKQDKEERMISVLLDRMTLEYSRLVINKSSNGL